MIKKCVVCSKEFFAQSLQHVCCSTECKLKNMKCGSCGEPLTTENASKQALSRGRGNCRKCDANRDKVYREKNPKSYILRTLKLRSRLGRLNFNLTADDVPDVPEFCPVLPWIRLTHRIGVSRKDDTPSVDRIDNTKGYIKGNIRIISWRANHLKGEASDKELIFLSKDVQNRLDKNNLIKYIPPMASD